LPLRPKSPSPTERAAPCAIAALAMLAQQWRFGQLIDSSDEAARDNLPPPEYIGPSPRPLSELKAA